MRCRKIIFYLNAYVDGELSVKRRRIVKAHLADCESCRTQLENIQALTKLFESPHPVPPVPEGLVAQIMNEAGRRQHVEIPESFSPLQIWTPLRWISGLSTPMRVAACAAVLLAIIVGLSFPGRNVTRRAELFDQGKNIDGLEWFAPVPPNSIGSIFIASANLPHEIGDGQ